MAEVGPDPRPWHLVVSVFPLPPPFKKGIFLKMLERVWRKGNLPRLLWECKLVQPLWKTVWRFLSKLKIELPFDPAIPGLPLWLTW